MDVRKIVIIHLLIIIGLSACNNQKPQTHTPKSIDYKVINNDTIIEQYNDTLSKSKKIDIQTTFSPDTSINNIYLNSPKTTLEELGNVMDSQSFKNGYEVYYFSNKKYSEYLKLIFHPGGSKNSFSQVIVSNNNFVPDDRKLRLTKYDFFLTESGIRLGIRLSQLKKIKGKEYSKTQLEGVDIYTYEISNFNESDFLKEYNMPTYTASYYFKHNELIQFEFGFIYP